LPSKAEWEELVDFAGDKHNAGKYLKTTNGWKDWKEICSNEEGEDKFGFFALPGGHGYFYRDFNEVGEVGRWWDSDSKYY